MSSRGQPGRPSNEFKRRMRELASSEAALDYLTECVKGKYGPKIFMDAYKFVVERGCGRVPQEVGTTHEEPLVLIVESLDEARAGLSGEGIEEARAMRLIPPSVRGEPQS